MKRKKITAILISFCITLSLLSGAAFGAEIDSKNLEQAIINVKSIISISDEYKNFSHSARQIKNGDDIVTVWDFDWDSDESEDGGYVSATVDSYGNLYSYSSNRYNSQMDGLAKVSRESAINTAREFLQKAVPDYYEDMRIVDSVNDAYSDEYNFSYQLYKNDIPVTFIKVDVGVNKYTGEVSTYRGISPGTKKVDYPQADGVIDIDTAKSMYIDKIQKDLSYYTTYNYKEKKATNHAWYSLNDNKAIDAKSGEVVKAYDSDADLYFDKYTVGTSELSSDVGSVPELSEVEKEEINNISGLISRERAQEIINETIDLFKNMKAEDIELNKSFNGNTYVWNINYDIGNAEVNAKTGEILEFYIYNSASVDGNSKIDKQTSQNKAEDFLKKIAGNKFAQTKIMEDYSSDEDDSRYEFNYIRQINGKDYMSNRLRVCIDKSTGNIVSYTNLWNEDVALPDISNAISKIDAFNKFNEPENFGLHYVLNEDNTVGLVYNFSDKNIGYYIDAVSGKKVDSWGEEYRSIQASEYSDIKGHWCEKTVTKLLDSGYYIPGDKFNPDNNISQVNFFRYMLSREASYLSDEELYNNLIERGILKEEERNSLGAVTNKEAAKFITRYLGYEKLAQSHEIFNNMFKDSIDDSYLGYADICYGLNIIKGDSKGNFNQNQNITNVRAAVYIYNMVLGNSDRYYK